MSLDTYEIHKLGLLPNFHSAEKTSFQQSNHTSCMNTHDWTFPITVRESPEHTITYKFAPFYL